MGIRRPEDMGIGGYIGQVAATYHTSEILDQLANLTERMAMPGEPGVRARNRLETLNVSRDGAPFRVMVKAFGPQNPGKDRIDARWGGKARRTYEAALALSNAGVGTPPPIAFLERWEGQRLRESYYVSVFVEGVTTFRDELIRLFRDDPECERFIVLMQTVADAVRAMHTAGFLHNDLGNQNILLRRDGDGWRDVMVVDLNRGRLHERLSERERARDVSRIYLPSDLWRVFREMLSAPIPPSPSFLWWERLYRRLYAVHAATRRVRHPVRTWRRRHVSDPNPQYPSEKDMWIWDKRSGQAVSVLASRDRSRYFRPGRHARIVVASLARAPRVWRTYRKLRKEAFRGSLAMKDRVGVAIEPRPDTAERERSLLATLGKIPVLARFYHHEGPEQWNFTARFLRELHADGYPVAVALVQDRRAVLDGASWSRFAKHVLNGIHDCVEWVEVGHAINRVKWGIWDSREYRYLAHGVFEAAKEYPDLRFMGPAAIDFEYPYVAAALSEMKGERRLAALSHHLYVDRRGAPENRQGSFSTLEKVALARALAATSAVCEDRFIVSEVNWPLIGTGVDSPVGAPYESPGPRFNDPSVSEDTYADYMIRYLLITTCSGLVERVYWWRLVAHGFGLVDDRAAEGQRERPAYAALRFWCATVARAMFLGRLEGFDSVPAQAGGDAVTYLFRRPDGSRVAVAYTTGTPRQVSTPWPIERMTDRAGGDVRLKNDSVVSLSGSPVYLFLK